MNEAAVLEIRPARYVLTKVAALATGLTEKAIRTKIDRGVWLEGKEWVKGPDGHVYIDLEGYARWVRGERKL